MQHVDSAATNAISSADGKPLTGHGTSRSNLTTEYLHLEKSTLSKKAQQIRAADIHDVDASQPMAQNARAFAAIQLDPPGGSDGTRDEVLLEDSPNCHDGVRAISDATFAAREVFRVRLTTQHAHCGGSVALYSGSPTSAQLTAQLVAAQPCVDHNSGLRKLGELKAQGILKGEDLRAAKRKLLGLA